jgi:N-acetylneuraminic acid mutarotase
LTEVAAAAHRGQIWVAGGLDADGAANNAVFVFDPGAGTWEDGPRLPEAIHHAALVSDGDALWLIGGYAGNDFGTPTSAVRRLDHGAAEWLDDLPLPEARAAGAAAWDGSAIVYGGGVEPGSVASEVFAQRDHAWDRIGRLSRPREHLAAASDGAGRTMFLGGRIGGLEGNLATVDLVEGGGVRSLGDLPTPRGGVAAIWWPSLGACLVGGESPGGTNAEVECIAPDGRQTRLNDLAFPRHGLGAVVLDGSAWTVLGGPEPGLFVSDIVEVLGLP